MPRTLCIYHDKCADGFGAAWAVWKAFDPNRIEFCAASYNEQPPDVTDRHVVMVDFSYKRPVIDDMARAAHSILILDHHKTAAEELAGLPLPPDCWDDWMNVESGQNVAAIFDMDRSGAGLAWDYFHDATRPPLIDLIEDRDLWRHERPEYPEPMRERVRSLHAYLMSLPRDFEEWDTAVRQYESDPNLADAMEDEGAAIRRNNARIIDEILDAGTSYIEFGALNRFVPVCNVPGQFASDAGHILAAGNPFSITYYDAAGVRHFSLRSAPDGMDVSEIAKRFGGGGHKHAAGFERSLADDFLLP